SSGSWHGDTPPPDALGGPGSRGSLPELRDPPRSRCARSLPATVCETARHTVRNEPKRPRPGLADVRRAKEIVLLGTRVAVGPAQPGAPMMPRTWHLLALSLSIGCNSLAGDLHHAEAAPLDEEAGWLRASAAGWIRSAPVSTIAVPDRIDAPGWLVLLHDAEARLATPVPGRVTKVHVRDGARVQAGDALLTLESAEAAQ